jgi:uncharacterized protein YxjI
MHPALTRNTYFVKEHVGMFKASNNYDILDPETGEILIECREDIGWITKVFRFTEYKRMTPFNVKLTTPDGMPILSVKRGISFILSKVQVLDDQGQPLGGFKQKLFSIGGKFDVLDTSEQVVCTLKGKWTSWDFSFRAGEQELASVTKKWAGLGRELFTSADNYILQINPTIAPDHPVRGLIMGAVMCIDMVLKE